MAYKDLPIPAPPPFLATRPSCPTLPTANRPCWPANAFSSPSKLFLPSHQNPPFPSWPTSSEKSSFLVLSFVHADSTPSRFHGTLSLWDPSASISDSSPKLGASQGHGLVFSISVCPTLVYGLGSHKQLLT